MAATNESSGACEGAAQGLCIVVLGDDLERARSVASLGVLVDEAAIRLDIDVPVEEWVVVQAYEKPFISLLWLGSCSASASRSALACAEQKR